MVASKFLIAVFGGLAAVRAQQAVIKELDTFTPDSETNAEGNKWLEEKFNMPDVNVLKSGFMYRVLNAGDGKKSPTASSPCDCHYEGKLVDGNVFDSSYKRGTPTTFAPNQVIKGWTEAMQLMVEGDKWEMFIPGSLAYGKRGAGGAIPAMNAITFQMELIKIKGASVDKKETQKSEL